MRNRIFLLISLILFGASVYASGVITPPQVPSIAPSTTIPTPGPAPSLAPSTGAQSNIQIPEVPPYRPKTQSSTEKPTLKPVPKIAPPIQIGTSADITKYKKISLPEAIDYAMRNNLDIQSTRLEIPKAQYDVKAANRLRNPYLQGYFNAGKAAEDNPNFFGMLFPIEIAKRGPRKKLAKSALELTKGNVALAELDLRLDVRQAYVDLVAAKTNLKILDDQRRLLQELLNIAQKKYEAGAVPQMDVIQAKMTLNQHLIQLNTARTAVLVARYKFNLLLESQNFDTKEDYLPTQKEFIKVLTPKPIEKTPSFDEILQVALNKRLDLKNAQRDIDVAQKNLTTVIRQRVPDVEIGGGYIFVPSQLATAERLTQGFYVAGNINNIPLLYQYTPEIKKAKLQVEQKQLDYANLKHHATMNLHSAYDTFITAQTNLNYYNDILLQESKQFLGMAQRSYMVGKSNITELIFIEQSYKNIMIGYTNALANYYDAWVDILREVNDEEMKLNG